MCLIEKTRPLDDFCSDMSYSAIGLMVNDNESVIYIK